MKHMIVGLLASVLLLGLCIPVLAADSHVTYAGHNIFGFGPGSEFSETDLFDNFKGVMPGDSLTQTITVKNTARCCDFVKIYMRAEVVDENVSPDAVSMREFLECLSMTVWNGDTKIAEGSPDDLTWIDTPVLLGAFRRDEGSDITVKLEVPATLGNAYEYREGEVHWVFIVEEYDDANPDVPQAGDESHIVLYLLVMTVATLCLLLVLLDARRRKKENE